MPPRPSCRLAALATLPWAVSLGQTLPPPPSAASAPASPVVQLSPFEVKTDGDVGYVATHTLGGSRLNTSLKDTPAIIDVFTKEFLLDIGATNLEQAMVYANNSQIDDGDAQRVNSGNTQLAAANSFNFRSRGLLGNSTRNYFETRLGTNLYNVERLDDARGPNSVLFGIGSAGGIVNNSPKRAQFGRAFGELGAQAGTQEYARFTVDYNAPLVAQRLALRLNLLDEDKAHWRHYLGNRRRAGTLAATWRPWANTEVRGDLERGRLRGTIGRNYPANDGATRWWRSGSPVISSATAVAPPAAQAALGINRPLPAPRRGVVENQDFVFNAMNAFATVADNPYLPSILRQPDAVPYAGMATGPGGRTRHDFANATLVLEQRFTRNLVGEIGYYHEKGSWLNYDVGGTNVIITGDPNGLLRNPAQVFPLGAFRPAVNAAGELVNPNAGRSYMETAWQRRYGNTSSGHYRATLAYEKDLGRWGRHRSAALVQRQEERRLNYAEREVWLGAPFNPEPANDNNSVWRRAYVTLGDAPSQRVPDPLAGPPLSLPFPGRAAPLTNGWIPNGGGTVSSREINSQMAALQSSWWRDRVVTTLGFRRDVALQTRTTTVRDATGIWAGSQGIQVFNASSPSSRFEFTGRTSTAGLVVHPLGWLSVFGNVSRNLGLPSYTLRYGPDGVTPPAPTGRGFDGGVLLSFARDRLTVRASYFTTVSRDEAATMGVDGAFTPDYNRIIAILDDPNGDRNTSDRLYTPAEMAKYPALRPVATANSDTLDNDNRGIEFRVTANLGENLRFILNYSYSFQERTNVYRQTYPLYAQLDAFLTDLQRARPGVDVRGARGTEGQTLEAIREARLEDLDVRRLDFEGAYGNRPHKANFFANYNFRSGPLRAWSAGLGGRYQSRIYAGRVATAPGVPPSIAAGAVADDIRGPDVFGNDSLLFDAMLRWQGSPRFLGRAQRLALQCNVRNLLDDQSISLRRFKTDGVTLDRWALTDPREVVFSATLRF
ncbi:MAG: hypothetical protein ACO3JJ_15450 [Opitutaceae bacterium]